MGNLIKKDDPLFDWWRHYFTSDFIGWNGERLEGVDVEAERAARRAHPKRRYVRKSELPEGKSYCCKCKRMLPVEEFYLSSEKGYQRLCKACNREAGRKYYLRKKEERLLARESTPPKPKPVKLTKVCCRCKIEKPLTEFYRSDDKYMSICKECDKLRRREHYHKKKTDKALASGNSIDKFRNEKVYYGDDNGRAE